MDALTKVTTFVEWESREYACRNCNWTGTGAEAACEYFYRLHEVNCPVDGSRIVVIGEPTDDQIREAAAAGHPWAQRELKNVEMNEAKERDRLAASLQSTEQLPELEGEALDFVLRSVSEQWFELWCGDEILFTEPAAWETAEPVQRIGALLRDKYGERARSFDVEPAMEILMGERMALRTGVEVALEKSGFGKRRRARADFERSEASPGAQALLDSLLRAEARRRAQPEQ